QHPDLPERPSVTARRFYYDTIGHGSQAALLCAWKAFGADHLVAGSDYPVLLSFETYRQTFHYIRQPGLPAGDVKKLPPHNAQIPLGLDPGARPGVLRTASSPASVAGWGLCAQYSAQPRTPLMPQRLLTTIF